MVPGHPSLTVVAGMLLLAAVPLIPLALVLEPFPAPTATALLSIMVLGVLCTAGGFAAFFALITAAGPARAALITYVAPIVAVAVILREPVPKQAILGVVIILLGAALATRRPRTPELKLKMEHRQQTAAND
jgi:drug/metabolite transporter (DMT)-like permease